MLEILLSLARSLSLNHLILKISRSANPLIVGRMADAKLSAHILNFDTSISLFEDINNLLFAET